MRPAPASRRLIIRPGAIGDVILALPAIESLRAEYTEVWVASQNVPLIRWADRVRSIAETGLDWIGIPDREPPRRTLELLSAFNSIVSWYGAKREEFRSAVAGFPFQFLPALPQEPAGLHAVDFFLQQVGQPCGAVPRVACARTPRDFAAIHPFSGSAKKNWPLERFREVAARLNAPVKWCVGPEEGGLRQQAAAGRSNTAADIEGNVPVPLPGEILEDAVRIADLYELACWLAGARLYIGNDSGITHLAAAAGTPVIALFGPTDARIWAPRGEHVRVIARERLDQITPGEVLRSASEMLSAPEDASEAQACGPR